MRRPLFCICGCDQRADQLHHCVYQQEIRRTAPATDKTIGWWTQDPRNLVPVARNCHGAHHGRTRPLELSVLPGSVYAFARELLGAGPSYEYLMRRYAGEDPRHDALLHEWEQAA